MFLRKMLTALGPLLLCLVVCLLLRWTDSWMNASSFAAYLVKGLMIGIALALVLPAGGIRVHTNGLTGWMWLGAGMIGVILLLQFFTATGALSSAVFNALFLVNGQVLIAESAVLGYMVLTSLLYRHK